VKTIMLLLGLTIQVDDYEPHLHLAPGNRLLQNIPKAKNWTAKRDAAAQPNRLPERKLAFRFGPYGQINTLAWEEDENVTKGYGDGTIEVADELLPKSYELAKLPFAATEVSPEIAGLLRILNFEAQDLTTTPPTYSTIQAKPRLTLRTDDLVISGQLITTPANPAKDIAQVLAPFESTTSVFTREAISLLLEDTVLTYYWQDLRAMLDESRYLTENYRLTPQDIAELDFSIPIWDGGFGDYFAVSKVEEYDARRSVSITLCRLNGQYFAPAKVPDGGEFWNKEFANEEFYTDGQ
jgi:hypothetical protein